MGLEFGVLTGTNILAYLWTSDYHVTASIIDEIPHVTIDLSCNSIWPLICCSLG